MKGIVWTTNIKDGNKMLEEIIENYLYSKIEIINKRNSSFGSSVNFENGDCW
jgi:hypothetical protein